MSALRLKMLCTAIGAVMTLSQGAMADGSEDVCFSAAADGQKARKLGKLHEAREVFTRCAQAACPAEVTERCTGWLAEVDEAMPSVLVATEDASGHDLARGTVRIDGQEQDVLVGKPVSLEPGQHVLVLEVPGEAKVEETIVLREHEKNRRVVLQLHAPSVVGVHKPSPVPFVVGSIGLAFAASFGVFGVAGMVDRQSSHCDVGCAASDYARVRAELVVADVSLGIAGVLLAVAIIDFAITRSASRRTALAPLHITF